MRYQYKDIEYKDAHGYHGWKRCADSNFVFWVLDDFPHTFEFRDITSGKDIDRNFFMRLVVDAAHEANQIRRTRMANTEYPNGKECPACGVRNDDGEQVVKELFDTDGEGGEFTCHACDHIWEE